MDSINKKKKAQNLYRLQRTRVMLFFNNYRFDEYCNLFQDTNS